MNKRKLKSDTIIQEKKEKKEALICMKHTGNIYTSDIRLLKIEGVKINPNILSVYLDFLLLICV